MKCPACGEENPEAALICGLCKTLFAKAPERRTQGRPHLPQPVPGPPGRFGLGALLAIVGITAAAGAGAGIYASGRKRNAPTPPPPSRIERQVLPSAAAPPPSVPAQVAQPRLALAAPDAAAAPAPLPKAPPIVEEAPVSPPPRLSVSSYWYEGADGHRRAKYDQQSARAPMLVYFRVDWCRYCQRLDKEVLPAPAVDRFLRDVVKVRINPETSPADQSLADSFGVRAFPSVFVVPSPDGRPEKVTAFSRSGNEDLTVTAERFVEACTKVGLRQSRNFLVDGARKARAGDFVGAREDLTRAIELDPRSAEAHYWRGLAAGRSGAKGKALGDLKRAIDLDPKWHHAYTEAATIYGEAGQLDDAIATLTRLADVDPDWEQGHAFAMRAFAHARKGDRDKALADFRQACHRGNPRACQSAGEPQR